MFYAFVHVRKTGGSTLDTILRQSFGLQHFRLRLGKKRSLHPAATAEEIRRCQRVYWQMKSISGHGVVPFSNLDTLNENVRFYTILRDPLHRCASDYQFRVDRGGLKQPFEEWIQTGFARNRHVMKLAGVESADAAIEMIERRIGFVALMERFDESLLLWKQWLDDDKLDIRYSRKNGAKHSGIKRELLSNPRQRELLQEANEEDQKLYDYVRRNVYRRQVVAYNGSLERDVREFVANNYPRPVFPRQLVSTAVRECVYKPLASKLRNKKNATAETKSDSALAAA